MNPDLQQSLTGTSPLSLRAAALAKAIATLPGTRGPGTGRLVTMTALAAVALAGCADMQQMSPQQRQTAIGAGVGALAGAAIGGNARSTAIGAGVGALGGYVWSRQMEQRRQSMEQATAGSGVSVSQTADNQLKLEIPADISFPSGRADIQPRLRPILDQFASDLHRQTNTDVKVIGHTDSVGSDDYNQSLSVQRAQSVKDYLSTRGVNPNQITVAGRGEREPIADNGSEAGRARNRRVEIFLGERASTAAR